MSRVAIVDLDDDRLAPYRALKVTNATRRGGRFVVEGEKLVERLLASRFPVDSVLAGERHAERVAAKVPEEVPLYVVADPLVDVLVGFNFHQGVLGCGVRRPGPSLEGIAGACGRSLLVICPRIDNPENLGSIIRIADVFGAAAVVVGPRCPDPLSRRVLRVSMGTSLRLPVVEPGDFRAAFERLRAWGFERAATVVDPTAEPLEALGHPERLAILLGSEGGGLEAEWVAASDRRVTIPMRPGAESLNVAVAAGIVLYHAAHRATAEPSGR